MKVVPLSMPRAAMGSLLEQWDREKERRLLQRYSVGASSERQRQIQAEMQSIVTRRAACSAGARGAGSAERFPPFCCGGLSLLVRRSNVRLAAFSGAEACLRRDCRRRGDACAASFVVRDGAADDLPLRQGSGIDGMQLHDSPGDNATRLKCDANAREQVSALLAFDFLLYNANRFRSPGRPSTNTFVAADPTAPRHRWGRHALPRAGAAWSLLYLDNEFAAHVGKHHLLHSPAAGGESFAEWIEVRALGKEEEPTVEPEHGTSDAPCPLPRALAEELAALGSGAAFVTQLRRATPAATLACMERLWRDVHASSARRTRHLADESPSLDALVAARFDALLRGLRTHWGCVGV